MIGQPLPRLEDRRFVTGNGRYTDDISLENQCYAAFLRSPHAHAVIRSIDTAAAAAASGVIAVLTGEDYLAAGLRGICHHANPVGAVDHTRPTFENSATGFILDQRQLPLAADRVRHVGEALAMVVAQTALQARDALELIEVDYDVLDAVVRADDALTPGAPQLWDSAPGNLCFATRFGDHKAVQQALAAAHHVVRRAFRNSRVLAAQMEPRSAIGCYDEGTGKYTLISGSQGVVRQRHAIADALGVPLDKVRVVSPDVGGGFGSRTPVNVEQLAVTWAARLVGRPVKWTSDRSEAFVGDFQGRDAVIHATIAFDASGRIRGAGYEWLGNVGAHPVSYIPMANGTRLLTSVYDVPALSVEVSAVLTNTVPTAPYRGAGRPEAMHVMERMLDIAAHELKIDRVELRRRNLIKRDQLPYRNPFGLTYDSGNFEANMDRALELSSWAAFEARRQQSAARGKLRGIGVANYIEAPVGAPRERIEMTVLPDGVVDIVSGTLAHGQGHETTFAQVVSAQLGVPVEAVRLRTGDTDFVQVGGGTHSDRSLRLAGTLLVQASEEIIEAARATACAMLGAQQVHFVQGGYVDNALSAGVSLFEVARHMATHGTPGDPTTKALASAKEFAGRLPAYPTGAAICELEIDPQTGEVNIVDYTSVDDVGQPVNPLIVEGQVHGGLAQGIGQALSEGYYIDASGQVLSGSYMDYGVPRASAMPPLQLELVEDPTYGNPLRVKGGGESGITPATAAIFNALADALAGNGTNELDMPATPAVIWRYIHEPRASQQFTPYGD